MILKKYIIYLIFTHPTHNQILYLTEFFNHDNIIEALFKEEISLTVDQAIETTISGSYLGIEGCFSGLCKDFPTC
jgi:hypothetical protein